MYPTVFYSATSFILNERRPILSLPRHTVSELEDFTKIADQSTSRHTFAEYINNCLATSGMTQSQLIQDAQIQRNYGYQILNGTKNPGRDKVLSLCLALSLPLAEVQRALTLAKEAILYPKNKRDSVLIFCINKKLSVLDTNDLLFHVKEKLLN